MKPLSLKILSFICSIVGTLVAPSVLAQESPLPLGAASYYFNYNYAIGSSSERIRESVESTGVTNGTINYSFSDMNSNGGQVTGSVQVEPTEQPSISLLGTTSSFQSGLGASASLGLYAELSYNVRLTAVGILPVIPLDRVPIHAFANYRILTSSNGFTELGTMHAQAQITIGDFLSVNDFINCLTAKCNQERTINTSMFFTPFETVNVLIAAFGFVNTRELAPDSLVGSTEFDIFVDPVFEIDPTFAYRDFFALEYSPNLTSMAPVPEPEIYTMFGLGLGLIGWAGRRRKLQAA